MKKLLFIPILLLISCAGNNDGKTSYHQHHILHTSDFKYLATVNIESTDEIKNGCKLEIDIYETNEMFRNHMDSLIMPPDDYYSFEEIEIESPLDDMKHMRSIHYSDRIRPIRCISESPGEELTDLIFINWIEGMEPFLGFSGHVVNRSDTALVVNISHEVQYHYLW